MQTEQSLLRISIIATVIVALVGVAAGILSGSSAIIFDGVYGIIDAIMTVLALIVARLIAASNAADEEGRNFSRRFTFGFWHLEPMVLGANGTLLTGAAIYALIDAIGSILAGGRPLSFDVALTYAGLGTIVDVAMAVFVMLSNRTIRSELVALDAKAWGMTAALGFSLFVAFTIGHFVKGTSYQWVSPYIDPAALLLICLIVIPVPFGTVRKAISEILLITPPELKDAVDNVARQLVERHGFISYHAFVARSGRGMQIELNILVPKGQPARQLEEWDTLRDQVSTAFGNDTPDLWFTIVFTTDPGWAW